MKPVHWAGHEVLRPPLSSSRNSFGEYLPSRSMLEVQKYGLGRFRDSRGDFWLDCQTEAPGYGHGARF